MTTNSIQIHGWERNPADRHGGTIQAVKIIRSVTGAGLRYAKIDVFDAVRDGRTVRIPVYGDPDLAVEELKAVGFACSVNYGPVLLTAEVPAEHHQMIRDLVIALGGTVN